MKNKKKIKVYLQYPWKFPDSPYYKYLIDNPPNSIEYLNVDEQKGVITNKSKFFFSNSLKRIIRNTADILKLPLPNVHLTKTSNKYDLIHCAHCLSLNKTPWVADFESEWQFFISGKRTKIAEKIIRKVLLNSNCKKIIVWTKNAQEKIENLFPEIKEKTEVVYPAAPLQKVKKKISNKIVFLFVGRYFYWKGGLHVLEVFNRLTKKYPNVECKFVSETPKEILKKYSKNKRIKFYDLMPQKKLFEEIYSKSDVFVYPGYSDTFGFALIEAMSFGLPVITVDGIARREIVQNGKTGFVIDCKEIGRKKGLPFIKREDDLIKGIMKKAESIIENKKLRERMSKNCMQIIKKGRFSIRNRNNKLNEIYKEALK